MGKYVSFGSLNRNYGFIILTVIFKMLKEIVIFGMNYNNSFSELNLYNILDSEKLAEHKLIHQIICYIGTIFYSWIFYKFGSETKVYDNVGDTQDEQNKKNSVYILLPIVILWVIEELIIYVYNDTLIDLDFWMVELLIPIGIIVYIFLINLRSYVNVKIKSLIEHKNEQLQYISPSEILMIYGVFGTIISSIICFFTSSFKCIEDQDIKDYLCKVTLNEDNFGFGKGNYFDKFSFYIRKLIDFCDLKEILIEVLIVALGSLTFFLYKYFFILVIKYLSPVHVIFSYSIYYLLQKIVLPVNTYFQKGTFIDMEHHVEYIEQKYTLAVIGDIIALIGFMIYLEIIQLNFWELDHNLRDTIIKRSDNDYKYPMNEIINEEFDEYDE